MRGFFKELCSGKRHQKGEIEALDGEKGRDRPSFFEQRLNALGHRLSLLPSVSCGIPELEDAECYFGYAYCVHDDAAS